MPIDAARVTRDAPFDGQRDERCPTDGVTRAAGLFLVEDDSDFEGRETYQDDIEDTSMFSVADGDDDAMFVIDMKVNSGCQRCGCTFFARGNCLQCGADDPGKQIMGCG